MKKRYLLTLGALALSGLGGTLHAQERISIVPRPTTSATLTFDDSPAPAPAPRSAPAASSAPAMPAPREYAANDANGWSWNPWDGNGSGFLSGLDVGASILILRPSFEDSTAFTINTTAAGAGAASHQRLANAFHWDYDAAPEVWIGWTCESGLGIRASYFNFDRTSGSLTASNSGATPINESPFLPDPMTFVAGGLFHSPGTLLSTFVPGGTDQLTFGSGLRLDSAVLEGSQTFTLGGAALMVTGGGRFFSERQNYDGLLTNSIVAATGSALETAQVHYVHTFSGGGPTASLAGRIPLFGDGGLAIYGNARGSVIVGAGHQAFVATDVVVGTGRLPIGGGVTVPVTNSSSTDRFASNREDNIPITEIEVGLEYGGDLGGFRLFTQAGVVAQTYFGAGTASSENGNLTLFGLVFSVGVSR